MRTRWLVPVVGLLWLAVGCAADAGGGKAPADAAIAPVLIAVLEASDPRAAARERGMQVSPRGVMADVQTSGLVPGDRARFDLPGVQVHHFAPRYERVSVSVADRAALAALARLPQVRRIAPEWGGATRDDAAGGGG